MISQKIEKGKNSLTFQLFFEEDNKQNVYSLVYYDAMLQKETPLTDVIVNGINTAALERSIAEIDWKASTIVFFTSFIAKTRKSSLAKVKCVIHIDACIVYIDACIVAENECICLQSRP